VFCMERFNGSSPRAGRFPLIRAPHPVPQSVARREGNSGDRRGLMAIPGPGFSPGPRIPQRVEVETVREAGGQWPPRRPLDQDGRLNDKMKPVPKWRPVNSARSQSTIIHSPPVLRIFPGSEIPWKMAGQSFEVSSSLSFAGSSRPCSS